MSNFVLLTKVNCPNCDLLKRMLAGPLKGRFEQQITVVDQDKHPVTFRGFVELYNVQSAPALINADTRTLYTGSISLPRVKAFLEAK